MNRAPDIRELEKLVPETRPPLRDVAEMPYPLSVLTMRRFYNPKWGVPMGEGPLKKWKASVQWETREEGTDTFTVEAVDEDEAKELAEEVWDKDHRKKHDYGTEIVFASVSEVSQ